MSPHDDDDFLARATKALRDEGEVPESASRAVRQRTLESLRRGERRRSRLVVTLVPIAAVLAAGVAFARNGAGPLAGWYSRIADRPAPTLIEAAPRVVPAPVTTATEAPAPPVDEPTPTPDPSPSAKVEATPAPSATPRPSASADDAEARALALYRRAHDLHFEDHDDAGALAAWNEYLRVAPGGRLAVEARYNRAMCLVRLGRTNEARAALGPFARGEVGSGYRRKEAQALLDALDAKAP